MFSLTQINNRLLELPAIVKGYGFKKCFNLDFAASALDYVPISTLIERVRQVISEVMPSTIYLPFEGDIHTDHRIVFQAGMTCSKWFRCPSLKKILVYEVLSETEFGMSSESNTFRPNVFVDITKYLDAKVELMKLYQGEIHPHPFPRSEESVRALASFRGATAGCKAAEAFMLIKEIIGHVS